MEGGREGEKEGGRKREGEGKGRTNLYAERFLCCLDLKMADGFLDTMQWYTLI